MSDKKLSFGEAYAELQAITTEFEQGELDLEKSIPKFKRAAELVKFLKTELKKIESQIEEVDLSETEVTPPATKPVAEPDSDEIPF